MSPDALAQRLHAAGILPIVTVRDVDATLSLVDVLARAGIGGVEIVLRTTEALSAIEAVRERFPHLLVAAGTVITPAQLEMAAGAGADFAISPGMPSALIGHPRLATTPLVPGAVTPTEVLDASARGFEILKYYPATAFDGVAVLADYANVFPNVLFMPTGKITMETLEDYARLPNTVCVGGSWMCGGEPGDIEGKVRRSLSIVDGVRRSERGRAQN